MPIHPEPRWLPRCAGRFVFGGAALISAIAINEMRLVLNVGGLTILEIVVLVLFALNTIWISLSVPTAIAGFVRLLFRRSRTAEAGPLTSRTALLMPLYNEEPARAAAALDAMASDLAARGVGAHFDLFILSDTTDGDIALAEEEAVWALRRRSSEGPSVYYRRRERNTAPQVRKHPGVLRTVGARLRSLPGPGRGQPDGGSDHHRAGTPHGERSRRRLIQTVPRLHEGTTLVARLQQFAGKGLRTGVWRRAWRGGRDARETSGDTTPSSEPAPSWSRADCRSCPGVLRSAVPS